MDLAYFGKRPVEAVPDEELLAHFASEKSRRHGSYLSCLRRGVIFRPLANYGMTGALRITIGTRSENVAAARALAAELPDARRAGRRLKSAG